MSEKKEFNLNSNNIAETKEQLILELYRIRKKAKITQTQISQLTKMPQATISRVESLGSDITLNTLVKYAEALGMELSITLKQKENTTKKYLVALSTGGTMEIPYIRYTDYQFIEAKNSKQATEIYDIQNNCSYFYGFCIGELTDNEEKILLSDYFNKKILEDLEISDNEEIYLIAKIDGGYRESHILLTIILIQLKSKYGRPNYSRKTKKRIEYSCKI